MTKQPLLATLAACLLALPCAGQAATVYITGDNTDAPLYTRTTVTGALSFQDSHYDAYPFFVGTSGAYDFSLVATANPALFDTFLHLYAGGFSAADPESNFLRANDDRVSGSPDFGSALFSVPLIANTQYYLVADGFTSEDYGPFLATLSGPGSITQGTAVPEPSTFVPAALAALGGVAFLVRRRQVAAAASR